MSWTRTRHRWKRIPRRPPSSTRSTEAVDPTPEVITPDATPDTVPDIPLATRRERRRQRPKRISKWDRPPDPHDWRFFVGNLGKVLIATGLMMFGFVAYQLWGTGIETARAQSALKSEFRELIAENQANRPAIDPDLAPPADDDPAADLSPGTIATPDDDATVDTDTPTATSAPATEADSGGVENTVPVAPVAPLVPVEQDIPPIFRGEPLALLEIPAIGRSDIVVPGVALNDLKDGPGHYPDSPLPGQLGNAAIAGHRTTYGAPFFNVDDLVPGDELIVTMLTGDQYTYEVTYLEIVSASDYWVVTTSNPDVAELTLTSCHPKYTARDRIVVHSVLNPAKSANVGFPTAPYELEPEADPEPIPGDDPVLEQPVVEPIDASGDAEATTSSTPPVTVDGSGEPAQADPEPDQVGGTATGATPTTVPQLTAGEPEVGDAFSQGWFDDRTAFPQIALWGLALTLIWLAVRRISRRFRHDSIGILVGIAPFLFCLYFFYQNVNRLLPPGL